MDVVIASSRAKPGVSSIPGCVPDRPKPSRSYATTGWLVAAASRDGKSRQSSTQPRESWMRTIGGSALDARGSPHTRAKSRPSGIWTNTSFRGSSTSFAHWLPCVRCPSGGVGMCALRHRRPQQTRGDQGKQLPALGVEQPELTHTPRAGQIIRRPSPGTDSYGDSRRLDAVDVRVAALWRGIPQMRESKRELPKNVLCSQSAVRRSCKRLERFRSRTGAGA